MVVPATTSDNVDVVPTTTHVVQFNPTIQLLIKLQGNLNFTTWKAQLGEKETFELLSIFGGK